MNRLSTLFVAALFSVLTACPGGVESPESTQIPQPDKPLIFTTPPLQAGDDTGLNAGSPGTVASGGAVAENGSSGGGVNVNANPSDATPSGGKSLPPKDESVPPPPDGGTKDGGTSGLSDNPSVVAMAGVALDLKPNLFLLKGCSKNDDVSLALTDPNLREAVRKAINNGDATLGVTPAQALNLKYLIIPNKEKKPITNLEGLQCFPNLELLDMVGHPVPDFGLFLKIKSRKGFTINAMNNPMLPMCQVLALKKISTTVLFDRFTPCADDKMVGIEVEVVTKGNAILTLQTNLNYPENTKVSVSDSKPASFDVILPKRVPIKQTNLIILDFKSSVPITINTIKVKAIMSLTTFGGHGVDEMIVLRDECWNHVISDQSSTYYNVPLDGSLGKVLACPPPKLTPLGGQNTLNCAFDFDHLDIGVDVKDGHHHYFTADDSTCILVGDGDGNSLLEKDNCFSVNQMDDGYHTATLGYFKESTCLDVIKISNGHGPVDCNFKYITLKDKSGNSLESVRADKLPKCVDGKIDVTLHFPGDFVGKDTGPETFILPTPKK